MTKFHEVEEGERFIFGKDPYVVPVLERTAEGWVWITRQPGKRIVYRHSSQYVNSEVTIVERAAHEWAAK